MALFTPKHGNSFCHGYIQVLNVIAVQRHGNLANSRDSRVIHENDSVLFSFLKKDSPSQAGE